MKKLKFVNAAGGVQKAAKALIAVAKGKNSSEGIERFGSSLKDLASEILGIKEIKDNCS